MFYVINGNLLKEMRRMFVLVEHPMRRTNLLSFWYYYLRSHFSHHIIPRCPQSCSSVEGET